MNEREEIDTVATRSQLRMYLVECKQTNTNIPFRKDSNPKDEKNNRKTQSITPNHHKTKDKPEITHKPPKTQFPRGCLAGRRLATVAVVNTTAFAKLIVNS